jgi:hypothetical protein
MHLVTKSYFNNFREQFNAPFEDTKNFEAFANYCIFQKHSSDAVDPSDLVYEGADPGIDGAFLFVEDRAIFSLSELEDVLASSRRELSFTVVFTQVKSSESWQKKEIDSFSAAIVDFLSEEPAQPHAEALADFKELFRAIYKNIGRVKTGRPSAYAYFATAAPKTESVEIVAAFNVAQKALEATGLFNSVNFIMAYRDIIHEMWMGINSTVEAVLPTVGYAPFPPAPDISTHTSQRCMPEILSIRF